MKIAILSHLKYPIAEPFKGGLEMITHALTRGLQERGHHVDLFAIEGTDPALRPTIVQAPRIDHEISGVPAPDHPDFNEEFVEHHHIYLDLMLKMRHSDYDVVFNNTLHYIPITMAPAAGTPVVTTLHVPPFPFLQSAVMMGRHYGGNHYVAISEHVRRVWGQFDDIDDVVYNGIDLDFFNFNAEANTREAFWCGRICHVKAPHLALKAARRAGVFLNLAGPMSDRDYFKREVEPLLDRRYNRYLGHMEQDEMRRYLAEASVYLFTSVWDEPYGLVLAEALACGTPIAAFRSGAVPEILTEKTGRIVAKGDAEALAGALLEAQTLNRHDCRARAEQFCDRERMVDEYAALFERIAATNTRKKRRNTQRMDVPTASRRSSVRLPGTVPVSVPVPGLRAASERNTLVNRVKV